MLELGSRSRKETGLSFRTSSSISKRENPPYIGPSDTDDGEAGFCDAMVGRSDACVVYEFNCKNILVQG